MSKLWTSPDASLGGGGGGTTTTTSAATTNNNNNNSSRGGNSITRTVLVHISGNRATWEHLGLHGALWQVNPERAACIFGDGYTGGDSPAENAAFAQRLSRAMIRGVTLIESNTNIDEVVAIHIDGLPPREYTKNGEGAALFLTGEGRTTQPQELFSMSGNSELGMQWMQQYPRYTSENLEAEGVIVLTGASYYFVSEEHPVIHFLKANEDQLGILIFQEPSLEGGWIRVDVDTFVYCIRSLRETVLRYTPSTFNLSNLTVRIAKPDGQRWLQLCPQLINSLLSDEVRESNDAELISEARRLGVQRYFDRPLFVTLRLAIEYALPEAVAPNTNTNSTAAASMGLPPPTNNNNNGTAGSAMLMMPTPNNNGGGGGGNNANNAAAAANHNSNNGGDKRYR
jgi:hypothetical protein